MGKRKIQLLGIVIRIVIMIVIMIVISGGRQADRQSVRNSNPDKVKTRRRTDIFWC